MNINMYNLLIASAIDSYASKAGSNELVSQLKSISSMFDGQIVISLDKQNRLSSETWSDNFYLDTVSVPNFTETPTQLLRLHDGSFLIVSSTAPIRHVTADFVTISDIPFTYTASISTSEYTAPARCTAIPFTTIDNNSITTGTCIFIPLSGVDIVQVYKWVDSSWSYVGKLGTLSTAGYATNQIDNPISVTGFYDETLSKFKILVSCSGTSSTGELSFIKRFELTLSGTPTDKGIISTPSVSSSGSMILNETKSITCMSLTPNEFLYALSDTLDELGLLDLNTTPSSPNIKTTAVKKGDLQAIEYADTLVSPTVFIVSDNFIITGDSRGHVALLRSDLKTVERFMGVPSNTFNTCYPTQFGAITDLVLSDSVLYIVAANGIYRTNFNTLAEQYVVYKTTPLLQTVEISKVLDLPNVTMSLDNETYTPSSEWKCKYLKAGTSLYIKTTRSISDMLAKKEDIPTGYLIVKL